MRTTVVDAKAKLIVTNGIVQVNEFGNAGKSIHGWLKMHMDQHPSVHYELVLGNNVAIELGAGDASRPDLSQTIVHQFDGERMNFGEEIRIRLISTTPVIKIAPSTPDTAQTKSNSTQPSEQDMWTLTRMPKAQLEAIVEQSLAHEPWRVVIAYCELRRRRPVVDPRTDNSFLMLTKVKNFRDAESLITDVMRKLGYPDYITLLKRLNELESTFHKPAGETKAANPTPILSDAVSITTKHAESKPWYKRWYVWLIALFIVGAASQLAEKKSVRGIEDEAVSLPDCSSEASLDVVKTRIQSLGYTYLSEQYIGQDGCKHAWRIMYFIDSFDETKWCDIATDGTSGTPTIVATDCYALD